MSLQSFITGIEDAIKRFATWLKGSTKAGIDIANVIKTAVDSPAAEYIVDLTPTNLDNIALPIFRTWLDKFLKDLGLVDKSITDINEVVTTAGATIAQMELDASKTGTLTTIAAAVNQKVAELNGKTISMQDAISTTPVAYANQDLIS
jgi:hypothetical protein